MSASIRPGYVLADRYRLEDLLDESRGARFWRARDRVLARHVAVHVISSDDERAEGLLAAARRSAAVPDRRFLRVLDAAEQDGWCYVVNEWGAGTSLDIMVSGEGPLEPRRAAWITSEVAAAVSAAHDAGVSHGRLAAENVLLDHQGSVRVIGLAVDAALHGLPPGRRSTDVVDLAAILYAGLTARWAGVSHSLLPPAPVEAGRVLRPRQVRAGIPRPLDALCEDVLGASAALRRPRHGFDLSTARGVADYLRAFVGDPSGVALPAHGAVPVFHPDLPSTAPTPPDPAPSTSAEAGVPTTAASTAPVAPDPGPPTAPTPVVELPTQAGMPIFDDESDEVTWLTARSHRPPPPPAFEEPAPRPLFAPDPVRRPRPGTPAASAPQPPPSTGGGTGSGTGSTGSPGSGRVVTGSHEFWPWPGTGTDALADPVGAPVPGRQWMRLALVIGVALLVMLAVIVASRLARSADRSSPADEPGRTATSADTGRPVTGLVAADLDPQGDPPEENPDEVGAAVDGDPTTAWSTMTYRQDLGPGGLKTGVGLVVDLGEERAVRSTTITFRGGPTTAAVFLTDSRPTGVAGLSPAGDGTARGRLTVRFDPGSTGRFLTVWLTSLPEVGGGYRGQIAEVVVSG